VPLFTGAVGEVHVTPAMGNNLYKFTN